MITTIQEVPDYAGKSEVLYECFFLLGTRDGENNAILNRWIEGGTKAMELPRIEAGYGGDIELDASRGRLMHCDDYRRGSWDKVGAR